MPTLWQTALGWLYGVRKDPCPDCYGKGYIIFRATNVLSTGPAAYPAFARATCHRCEGSGSVEFLGTPAPLARETGRSIQGMEPGTNARAKKVPLTNAEKQHRYRERKKATDPNYLSREAARLRELRKA